ncbi:MAG: hypothetical protein F6K55_05595 [Moorea sp. SIO4A3]|nr:hypothetical protein [Moorena sp. SIO4A3]
MTCFPELVEKIDQAVENYEFPFWGCGFENSIVAKMRTSGFITDTGVALIFEKFEYFVADGFIHSVANCISTFSVTTWVNIGDSMRINLRCSESGEFPVHFGTLQVVSHGQEFSVPLERDDLIDKEYLPPNATELTPEAVLLKIGEVVPRDFLFSEPNYLKRIFGMDDNARRVFVVEEWQHPSFDEVYSDGISPSKSPDIRTMAETLCQGISTLQLAGKPNTSWQAQCKKSKKSI